MSPEVEIKVHPWREDGTSDNRSALPPPPLPSPSPPQRRRREMFRRWNPWLVPVIVAVNVVVFGVTMYVNDCPRNSTRCVGRRLLRHFSFQGVKENPLLGPSAITLEKMGALDVTKVVHGHQGWRLITCVWLHAGVVHVLANMLGLLFIGIRLEQEFGFVRIGLLYLISGFGGSMLSALFIRSSISVGASGALFGLLGSMLSELLTNWSTYANKFAALLTLVLIVALNLAVGILPHVDNFAHIGGFITGLFLGFIFLIRPQFKWTSQKFASPGHNRDLVKRKHKMYQYVLWAVAAIFLIVWFTAGLIMLFRGVNANDNCSWCHYLSCVPSSRWKCDTSSAICEVSQNENQVTVSCQGQGRSQSYFLPNATQAQIYQLCNDLCG